MERFTHNVVPGYLLTTLVQQLLLARQNEIVIYAVHGSFRKMEKSVS